MTRTIGGAAVLLALFAGTIVADDVKSGKDAKKPTRMTATVVKADAATNTLIVKTKDGTEKNLTIGKDTQVTDYAGATVGTGHNLQNLTPGMEVRLIMSEDGKTLKEIRLPAKPSAESRTARPHRSGAAGAVNRVQQLREQQRGQTATNGIISKVDADKKTLHVRVKGKDGKEQEKTIELSDDIKLVGINRGSKLADIQEGSAVSIIEKKGKVIEVMLIPGSSDDIHPTKTSKRPMR
jgi:hypothetical protein